MSNEQERESRPEIGYLPPKMTPLCQCKHDMVRTMFCETGHMLECHFPMTCDQAGCTHLYEYWENADQARRWIKAAHFVLTKLADVGCEKCNGTGGMKVPTSAKELYGPVGMEAIQALTGSPNIEVTTLCDCVIYELIKLQEES